MAMADAKGSLDYWRKYFSSAKSDIFDLIDKAILVAAMDWPKEFKDKKDMIVEKLYTCQLSLNNGDHEYPKEEKNSCNSGNSDENDQILEEVMRIKEVLSNTQLYESDSDSVLYESLRSLQMLQLSVEILKATEIGRTVSALRKHNSSQIRKLVRTLIDGWKMLVDEWVKSTAPITENTITDSVNKLKNPSITNYEEGFVISPAICEELLPFLNAGKNGRRALAEFEMRSPNMAMDEEFLLRATPPSEYAVGGRRKPTAGIRAWMVISESRQPYLEEAGKHLIMRRTGLPARDLRVLDPQLSYPSTILGRERAIVINLEHVKAVITAMEVLVPNCKDPFVAPFLQDLQTKVASSFGAAPKHSAIDRVEFKRLSGRAHCIEVAESSDTDADHAAPPSYETIAGSPRRTNLDAYYNGGTKVLPFEFRALEVCLESACRLLESETLTLEQEAYPALDELTSKINTLNLERVRQIKSRLVALSGRVQKVRNELEHLLDDDTDMAEMYLTEKLAIQLAGDSASRVDIGSDELKSSEHRETESTSGISSSVFKLNIEELEMLLEAYFVQIDGTLNKLSTLREYVDDTEDYINIMLDEKQNQLLQMGILLNMATLFLTAGVVVTGIFGMNITIDLYNVTSFRQFWETTYGTVGGCVILCIIAIVWGKKSGLLH